MTRDHTKRGHQYAVLLSFLSGSFILLCHLLHLGFLIDFISLPVISGFTSAAAVTIASLQMSNLLGISIPHHERSNLQLGVVDSWVDVARHLDRVRWEDASLGISSCLLLLGLRVGLDHHLSLTLYITPEAQEVPSIHCQAVSAFWSSDLLLLLPQ